jgi:hypothetical protein
MPNRLSAFFYGEKAADRESVTVFDVGCSGGLGTEWDIFGASLRATGFDHLLSEVERLRRTERRPNVDYEAFFVGLNAAQEKEREEYESALSERNKFFPDLGARSSAARAVEILSYDQEKEIYNSGADIIYSSHRISLDEFAERHSLVNVDILKIDTDGHDIEVLIGAQKLLGSTTLGAKIECFFHRQISPYANSFSNVDRIMTSKGFHLFDIRLRTYTRGALPGPFQYEIFAQTTNGSPRWADVLYLRDLAHPDYEMLFGFQATPERIIKTACLMEAYGLQDCAAELIINRADRLSYPINQMLDLLVPNSLGLRLSYREYMERFTKDPRALFPSRLANKVPSLPFITGRQRELPLESALSFPHWNANLSPSADGGLSVTTSHHKWAYAMILPLPDYRGPGVLVVEAEAIEGQVGVSIANAEYTELAAETILSVEDKRSTIVLPVSGPATRSALMIRNGSREAPSCAAISRVALFAD